MTEPISDDVLAIVRRRAARWPTSSTSALLARLDAAEALAEERGRRLEIMKIAIKPFVAFWTDHEDLVDRPLADDYDALVAALSTPTPENQK